MNPLLLARVGTIVLLLGTVFLSGWWVNGWRWEVKYQDLQAEHTAFVNGVAREGEQAKTKNALIALSDLKKKERVDEENRRTTAALRARIKRMRNAARTGGGGLSAPAPAPADPTRTCFDPAGLAGALRSLDEGLLGIIEEGAKAVIDLDTAKKWAQKK